MKFYSIFIVTGICLLLSGAIVNARAEAGPGTSGGGTGVSVNGKNILLDLYVANPNIVQQSLLPGLKLPETKALNKIHLENLSLQSSSLEAKIMDRLKLWEKNSPELITLIKTALKGIFFYYTDYKFKRKDDSQYIPSSMSSIKKTDLTSIAFYEKDFGVLLSKPVFESLDEESQAGLILHEVIRHMQIQYGYQMSTKSLQTLTAKILLESPAENESLDEAPYLDGKLQQFIAQKKKLPTLLTESLSQLYQYKEQNPELFSDISINCNQALAVEDQQKEVRRVFDIMVPILEAKVDDLNLSPFDADKYTEILKHIGMLLAGDALASYDARTIELLGLMNALQDTTRSATTDRLLFKFAIEDANKNTFQESPREELVKKVMEMLIEQGALYK